MQMKRKLRRGKNIKKRRSDQEEAEVYTEDGGKDGQRGRGEGGEGREC